MPSQKIAIIGCGAIGKVHVDAWSHEPRAHIACLVDLLPEKAQALLPLCPGAAVETDYRRMLADPSITAVSVCLPNHLHCPVTLDALRAGKHVLCEKPIALNLAEALSMQAEAARAGKILNIGVVNRWHASVNLIKDMIAKGELGEVYHVSLSFRAFRSIPGLGGWFTDKKRSGGGVLIDWGVHFIDLALYALGLPEPRTVSGVTHARLAKKMEDYKYLNMWAGPPDYKGTSDVEEYVSAMIRTSGPSIALEGAWAQNLDKGAMHLDFLGDKAGLRMEYRGAFTVYGTRDGHLYELTPKLAPKNDYHAEISGFVDSFLSGKKDRAHIDEVLVSQRILDGVYRSAAEGREIDLRGK
ncbi:MAG: Gfo/Idh/MocA family oxidoreductase [Spirochaetes bacterium]|nr:Gfo/Idh/MocA family oxidoreductase [Spirochaetota bacterium]